ncbi:probable tRNA methyltransferase 9B [Clupea harengus]|uniref:Probable tRNA methyltransferase 9B n=1 Tax=Clupea harengus TaxID=7950 RepID=A0A6P8G0A9_CLUHA|nr:probable tRNA methyltransferase 9B [Clupea harengus]
MEDAACQLERDHVHNVYEKIAPFFNDSRYKAWPKVRKFLLEQEPGSIVADVGCGNGKYLHINENVFKLGCDICRPLVESAWNQGHEVQLCDSLRLPYRDGCFDAILSIAVIHHFSTKERRIRAIKEMARTLRMGGRMMIYVWAMEQKTRKFEKQDIFVPWNPNLPCCPNCDQTLSRYRAQGEGLQGDGTDKHRKVKSTSSMLESPDSTQPRTQRLWFFSRSLDSVLDFGSPTVSRSSSRELHAECPPAEEKDGSGARSVSWGRGGNFIQQVSSLFSSRSSLEEDIFGSVTDLCAGQRPKEKSNGGSAMTQSVSLVQECSSMPLPDLVSYQKDMQLEERERAGNQCQESRHPLQKLEDGTRCVETCCESEGSEKFMRYYHVFRHGELTELIENNIEELHVMQTCLDHANWCVVAEKVKACKNKPF